MSQDLDNSVGSPPGSLELHPGDEIENLLISLTYYNQEIIEERQNIHIEECLEYLNKEGVTWINVTGTHNPSAMEKIGKIFQLHPLLLEDIASSGERSKIETYEDNVFIILRLLDFDKPTKKVVDYQVSIILGKNYVISFFNVEAGVISPIKERIRRGNNRIRRLGADYLTYTLIDIIVDKYFVILAQVDEKLGKLEDELVHDPSTKTLYKIQKIKREMTVLRRTVWPMRELISQFMRLDSTLIQKETHFYIHDVYDHTIQAIDTIEGFRDIVGGMLEIYMSTISQRLNEIMKVLTVVATIFAPITFLTGIYGMNFDFMPGIHNTWGFFVMTLFMFAVSGSMLLFFRIKRWI